MKNFVLAALALVLSGVAVEAETIKVTVPAETAGLAQFFVTERQGYFKDEGLDVELHIIPGGPATPALIAGSTHYSASTSSAMTASLKGANLRVILIGQSRPQAEIWSFDPAVQKFEDLKGKVVTVTSLGGADHIQIRMILKAKGLPADYLGVSPLSGGAPVRIAGVQAGSLKLLSLSRTERLQLEPTGLLAKGKSLSLDADIELPLAGLATTAAELNDRRDRVKKVLRAIWKGTLHLQAYPDDAIDALHVRMPKLDRASMIPDMQGAIEDLDKDGEISMETASGELAIRGELLNMKPEQILAPEKLYDFSVIREVRQELANWKPKK
jgi:ABC-type nitrate/sulfonate/bicarbonate transport system substrate-binding protein